MFVERLKAVEVGLRRAKFVTSECVIKVYICKPLGLSCLLDYIIHLLGFLVDPPHVGDEERAVEYSSEAITILPLGKEARVAENEDLSVRSLLADGLV